MLQVELGEDNLKLIDDDDEDLKASNTLRQPYRIFSELPSDPGTLTMSKLEAEDGEHEPAPSYVPIQLATDSTSGLQTLTMTNVNSTAASVGPGTTVLQYATAQGDGPQQFFTIPAMSALSAGNIQYQLAAPAGTTSSASPQSIVMTTNGTDPSQPAISDEAKRKRELRLLKNREAALECRRKKKDYIKCLENRVALLENQNKTLIEELKSLKELYCQKDVG